MDHRICSTLPWYKATNIVVVTSNYCSSNQQISRSCTGTHSNSVRQYPDSFDPNPRNQIAHQYFDFYQLIL